ncbi:ATP phosphoribosyltransferase [Aggregatilineales bacterium SYSU G02658]
MKSYTLALPSKGELAEPTYNFLREAGLKVVRPNARQYTGHVPALPQLGVLYQRVKDVAYKVADGTAQLGIAGLDIVREYVNEEVVILHDNLNYGQCKLVVAVPEAWVDVQSLIDLQEVADDMRQHHNRNLRVATTFPNLTRRFFHDVGIHHFSLVRAEGAIEAAPTIGYADAIVDLTQSGTTLRENHLKMVQGGTILESQACLIGNRAALLADAALRSLVRQLLDYVDATLNGQQHCQITADICGDSAEAVAALVNENIATRGLLGPTVAPIYDTSDSRRWYTVQITVKNHERLAAVDYLRSIGAAHVLVAPVQYLFLNQSTSFLQLLRELGLD